jgi:hypothetical protein
MASDQADLKIFDCDGDPSGKPQSAQAHLVVPSSIQLRGRFRVHTKRELYDESGAPAQGLAIYTLSDPRDIREVRYVGQTSAPRRRFLQHLNQAQLSLPDECPWWVKVPKLRPLYAWVRALYRDEGRLPVMVVMAWAATLAEARADERARIFECLSKRLPLLNVETEILQGRFPLLESGIPISAETGMQRDADVS